jgi:hypothetical protein
MQTEEIIGRTIAAPPPITYPIAEATIAQLRTRAQGVAADTPEGYDACKKMIAETRGLRGQIEKRRVELKADALKYGREVDGLAKTWTLELLAIEEPLKLAKQKVDDEEIAKARAMVEAQEKAASEAAEAKAAAERAEREAAEAKIKAEREALEAERKAFQEQQAQERRKREQEQAEALERELAAQAEDRRRAALKLAVEEAEAAVERNRLVEERKKIEEDRKLVEAEKARLQTIAWEQECMKRAKEEARRKVEQEAMERQAREKREEEEEARRKTEETRRVAEAADLLPDVDKIKGFATTLCAVRLPMVKQAKAVKFMTKVTKDIEAIAKRCLAVTAEQITQEQPT